MVNAATDEKFWQLPAPFEAALREALPANFTLTVCRDASALPKLVKESAAVIGWPFAAALGQRAPKLRWVHFFTAGLPESWAALASQKLRVTTAAGINASSVAQHALFLVLSGLRGLRANSLTPGSFSAERLAVARNPADLSVCVVGHGHVGRRLVPMLEPLFHTVSSVSRTAREASPDGCAVRGFDSLHEVVAQSDVIVLALPLTQETRTHFCSPRFYAALRPDVCLVNVARGGLIDERALLAHLSAHPASTYLTDVTHPEPYPEDGALWTSAQVIITPHVAGRRDDLWQQHQATTLRYLRDILHGWGNT